MFENRSVGLALVLPAAIFAAALFLLPVGILLSEAFRAGDGWSIQAYIDFFASSRNQTVFFRTLKLAGLVAGVSAVIGYAAAFAIVNLPATSRGRMFGLVTLPLMISPVARTYAWLVILGRTGFVNQILVDIGITETPLRILFTETAVFIGLLQLFLPLMIISLVSAMENMPKDAVPAARILGANWFQVFWRVILPLTAPGIASGAILVFVPALGAVLEPILMGGGKQMMMGSLIQLQFGGGRNWPFGSAIAVMLLVFVMVVLIVLARRAALKEATP